LCHDLDAHSGLRFLVSHFSADHPDHQKALAALIVALQETFTWTLTRIEANVLLNDLDEGTCPPEQCHYDEKYSVTKIFGIPMCHGHAAAADRAVEESAS